jgi:hypothetical protein
VAIATAAAVVGLGIAYLTLSHVTTDTSEPDETAPVSAPPATPPAGGSATPPAAPATPSVERQQPAENIAPPVTAPPTNAAIDDRAEPPPEILGEHDDEFATTYLQISERFRTEPRDPTSAVSLERQILDRFASITGLAVTTLDVSCKTTTCRVRMVEQPGAEFQQLPGPAGFQNIVEGFGTVVSNLSETDDGSTVFEWLLARDPPPPK